MKKERILLIIGIWVAILPYLGFPSAWKDVFFTLTGLGIIYISYLFYHQFKKSTLNQIKEKIFDNFVENNNFNNITNQDGL